MRGGIVSEQKSLISIYLLIRDDPCLEWVYT